MQPIIFQSAYADDDYTTLKHAVLYFGRIRIPAHSFFYTPGEPHTDVRYVTMPPEPAYEHLEALHERQVIELVELQPLLAETTAAGLNPEQLFESIVAALNTPNHVRTYSRIDTTPLYSYLQVDRGKDESFALLLQIATFLAALALQPAAAGLGLPCTDNAVLFDLINAGARQILTPLGDIKALTPVEVSTLKANLLAQHVLARYLPTFAMHSFDDVLELRDRLKDSIDRFGVAVSSISTDIEARPWDPTFLAEIEALIRKKVDPELAELRKASAFSASNVAWRMTKSAGIVLSANHFLPDFASAFFTGGILSLADAISHERDRTDSVMLRSGLSFLLQANPGE